MDALFHGKVPAPFSTPPGKWLLVPRYHLFGTEELSAHSPGAAELAPKPCVFLSRQDAGRLGFEAGDRVEVSFGDIRLGITVAIGPELPSGVAAYPCGPCFPFAVNGPVYCVVTKRP
jgi:NADH-quinone oxidoreductase subunit G